MTRYLTTVAWALASAGCACDYDRYVAPHAAPGAGPGGATGGGPGDGDPGAPDGADGACASFERSIAPVLAARCDGCHEGAGADGDLDLSAGSAYEALVGTPSAADPSRLRVAPGDADASYLIAKLEGRAGDRMPLGGSPLDATTIARFRAWIDAGAPRGSFGACDPAGARITRVDIRGATTMPRGALSTFDAQAVGSDGQPLEATLVTWTSSDPLTVFVDDGGVALAVRPGRATLVATADGVASAPVSVSVSAAALGTTSFAGEVAPLLRRGCALSGCHVDGVERGDLRLDRDPDKLHDKLVGERAETHAALLVAPGDAPASFVFQKVALDQPVAGARMPYGGGRMPAAEVQVLLRWIDGGARP